MARTTANFRLSLCASLASLVAAGVGFGAGFTRALVDRRAARTKT